jgi:hypothetical protein
LAKFPNSIVSSQDVLGGGIGLDVVARRHDVPFAAFEDANIVGDFLTHLCRRAETIWPSPSPHYADIIPAAD